MFTIKRKQFPQTNKYATTRLFNSVPKITRTTQCQFMIFKPLSNSKKINVMQSMVKHQLIVLHSMQNTLKCIDNQLINLAYQKNSQIRNNFLKKQMQNQFVKKEQCNKIKYNQKEKEIQNDIFNIKLGQNENKIEQMVNKYY